MSPIVLKLSPSSATDFKSCPQLFKFRAIDNLPEPVSDAAARGSLIHLVLERLFDDEQLDRTPERALELLSVVWSEVRENPGARPDGLESEAERGWLEQAHRLLGNYFKLEDPTAIDARKLEWWVEYELSDIHLRGIIDRLEVKPDGAWILTDYKTGRIPSEQREIAAFFGLRFYALVCWRAFGIIPAEIRLVYLSDPSVLTLNPHQRMLVAFERQMRAIADAVRRAEQNNDWRPRPSPFCMSCSFQQHCPAWAHATAGRNEV